MKKTKRYSISMRESTYKRIKEHCDSSDLSLAGFIDTVCNDHLDGKSTVPRTLRAPDKSDTGKIDFRQTRF